MSAPSDSKEYLQKKQFYSQLLTVYGRKPVLEALQTPGVEVHRVHLSDSNKKAAILDQIVQYAEEKQAQVLYHSKEALARISKNKKQDQGVAVDLKLAGFQDFEDFHKEVSKDSTARFELIALDNVTNPQNLGMIIRSVCASPMRGLLIPKKGCAKLDSLVIKASAGTIFKANIIRCDNLAEALTTLKETTQSRIVGLDVNAKQRLSEVNTSHNHVFVLGNESEGLSQAVTKTCNGTAQIPMQRGVESLNVAITASLIAFRTCM